MTTPPASIQPGKYRAILADPPWDLHQKGKYGAGEHYDLMTMDRIRELGKAVEYAAADQSYLFLWVTNAVLPYAFDLMKDWGYTYTSFYVWVKPRFTLGNTFRNAAELLLLGTRGKGNKFAFRSQPNWGLYPLQEHSRKPEEIHQMIERCVGGGDLLELFARRPSPTARKWDVWGNEVDATVSLKDFGFDVPADYPDLRLMPDQTEQPVQPEEPRLVVPGPGLVPLADLPEPMREAHIARDIEEESA